MRVSGFMTPKKDVVSFKEGDPISAVLDTILDRHISSAVIMDDEQKPKGIVTKTDLIRAYKQGIPVENPVGEIMATNLKTVLDTEQRDDAAKSLEKNRTHHAIVVDKDGNFVGIVSAWDIASEVALDARAWPWNRTESGAIGAAANL